MSRSSHGDEGRKERMPWEGSKFNECVGQKEGQWEMESKMRQEWLKGPNHLGPCRAY